GGTTTGGTGGPKSPSGQGNFASDVGVTADSIKIGNVTAIGGALGPNAFGVTLNGLKTFVSAINDQGGVNGRKLVLDPCDDGADGTRNLSCTQKLVEQDKVFSLLGNNTDASASSANYEFKKGIPDVGFPLNNGYYKYPNMYSIYGVGYARDGKTVGNGGKLENTSGLYRYFKQQAHATKAAVFYYIIPVSAQAGCFEEQGALKEGIPTVYEGGGGNGHCLGAGENPAARGRCAGDRVLRDRHDARRQLHPQGLHWLAGGTEPLHDERALQPARLSEGRRHQAPSLVQHDRAVAGLAPPVRHARAGHVL